MQNQSTIKNLVFVVVVVVAVAVLIMVFASKPKEGAPSDVATPTTDARPDTATVAKNKPQILSLVSSNKVLSRDEREIIITALSGDKINYYNFSDEEKVQIIEALNRK